MKTVVMLNAPNPNAFLISFKFDDGSPYTYDQYFQPWPVMQEDKF